MKKTELENLLNKIGKRIFVKYYNLFGDSDVSAQVIVTLLQSEESFKPQASATRTTNARRIFCKGLERQALSIIANSSRVEQTVAIEAKELLSLEIREPVDSVNVYAKEKTK